MVNNYKHSIKNIVYLALCFIALQACAQHKPDNNMKWINKFDFFDIYQMKVMGGSFNPGAAIRIEKINIPDENTIILATTKDQSAFNESRKSQRFATLFISHDKGKSYEEIILGDESIQNIESRDGYTCIETFVLEQPYHRMTRIYLLNNKTLELKKVIDRPEEEAYYSYFTGKYIVETTDTTEKLINLHNLDENYIIPIEKIGKSIFQLDDGKLIYKINNEILEYNVLTDETKVLRTLKNVYDYFFYIDGHLTLQKLEFKEKDDEHYGIYNIDEEKLYVENNENRFGGFYRYGDFICDYRDIGAKPQIKYSYDRGKTWKTHNVTGFTILQKTFGFYKDQFLVTEGVFWKGDSPESGGRIMVGEFVK